MEISYIPGWTDILLQRTNRSDSVGKAVGHAIKRFGVGHRFAGVYRCTVCLPSVEMLVPNVMLAELSRMVFVDVVLLLVPLFCCCHVAIETG